MTGRRELVRWRVAATGGAQRWLPVTGIARPPLLLLLLLSKGRWTAAGEAQVDQEADHEGPSDEGSHTRGLHDRQPVSGPTSGRVSASHRDRQSRRQARRETEGGREERRPSLENVIRTPMLSRGSRSCSCCCCCCYTVLSLSPRNQWLPVHAYTHTDTRSRSLPLVTSTAVPSHTHTETPALALALTHIQRDACSSRRMASGERE